MPLAPVHIGPVQTEPGGAATLPRCFRPRAADTGTPQINALCGLPAFVLKLGTREAAASLALEFAILTATRSGEVIGVKWSKIDLAKAVWTNPASRMKAGKEHRVPLSQRAIEILEITGKDKRISVFWQRWPQALSGGHDDAASSHEGRLHREWLPQRIPGLGRRVHRLFPRGLRNSARACDRK